MSLSPMRLFAPYWRTIAVGVVNDLLRRPQTVQQMSDLLSMTVTDFLSFTQMFTLPYLIVTKKRDILQRISDACNRSPKSLCMEHHNWAAILTNILMQDTDDVEQLMMGLLAPVSSDFAKIHYSELLKAEQPLTAGELLKVATEDEPLKIEKVCIADNFPGSS